MKGRGRGAQPAGPDEGADAGDGRQGDGELFAEDGAHGGRARAVRRHLGDVVQADDVLGLPLLGVRREQEAHRGW